MLLSLKMMVMANILNVYHRWGSLLRALGMWLNLNLTRSLYSRYYFPQFTYKKTKAQICYNLSKSTQLIVRDRAEIWIGELWLSKHLFS